MRFAVCVVIILSTSVRVTQRMITISTRLLVGGWSIRKVDNKFWKENQSELKVGRCGSDTGDNMKGSNTKAEKNNVNTWGEKNSFLICDGVTLAWWARHESWYCNGQLYCWLEWLSICWVGYSLLRELLPYLCLRVCVCARHVIERDRK